MCDPSTLPPRPLFTCSHPCLHTIDHQKVMPAIRIHRITSPRKVSMDDILSHDGPQRTSGQARAAVVLPRKDDQCVGEFEQDVPSPPATASSGSSSKSSPRFLNQETRPATLGRSIRGLRTTPSGADMIALERMTSKSHHGSSNGVVVTAAAAAASSSITTTSRARSSRTRIRSKKLRAKLANNALFASGFEENVAACILIELR